MPIRLAAFLPAAAPISGRERLRSALGALVGLLATGVLSRLAVGEGTALPVLIAPMGASAVLLFAVPASPLAQPWSILGGNLVASLVGVTVARLVPDPFVAAALAGGLAIAAMMALRCLHPPSGAVALTAVLGGAAVRDLGYGFVLWPVLANSAILLGTALAFNNLAGRSYPHRPLEKAPDHGTADRPPTGRIGFSSDDLDAVLAEYDQLIDVDRGDLEAILRQAEIRSYRRRAGQARVAAVMSRDVVAIAPDASIGEALDLLRAHHIKVLPVTDETARVIGIVTQTDLLDKAAWDRRGPKLDLRHRLRLTLSRGRAPNGSVADIMTAPVRTLGPEALIADAVRLMASTGLHHLPVVEPDGRLAGIVSQSDLLVALLAEAAGRPSEPA
ncbi:membrane protein [Aureimonas endophytica]|uniref:Membrane protein n=1 Tax=Aureimonas endophytica TaxID=2027858 RepID=A0A917E618_9HYPH|nr:HPP family protein [Aureimonas endophytica]GGE06540.1 membrane protein [Aureimonas endophytica]